MTKDEIRAAAEANTETFIRLVHPQRVLGSIHCELLRWWDRQDAKSHQLVLLPRDHQKSAMVAYRVARAITRNPATRVLYVSSTSNLAVKQLKFIKDILTSPIYRRYWPEMVNIDEAKREKWTETEISVDHPARKEQIVRDPTVFAAGLTTNIVGMHCDICVLDDVVVDDTAYTEEGRERLERQYSLLAAIEGTEGQEWAVGTRYHPKDLYSVMMNLQLEMFNQDGEPLEPESIYEVFERQVEDRGDGTGEFLWPVQMGDKGRRFGFNAEILARKKAQFRDRTQFYAQYYNNPNSVEEAVISKDCFQYYDKSHLRREGGYWYLKGKRLNVFAAVDFAYSLQKRADYTTVVVVGVDGDMNYYVLDIERFKTQLISDYYDAILRLHVKWDFRRLRAEVTAAQQAIVSALKQDYIRRDGLALSVDDNRPSRSEGSKEERIEAILQARYNNRQIWHYQGGNCQLLEEELVLKHPPHDDIKDALASAIDFAKPPTASSSSMIIKPDTSLFHPRFGGVYG